MRKKRRSNFFRCAWCCRPPWTSGRSAAGSRCVFPFRYSHGGCGSSPLQRILRLWVCLFWLQVSRESEGAPTIRVQQYIYIYIYGAPRKYSFRHQQKVKPISIHRLVRFGSGVVGANLCFIRANLGRSFRSPQVGRSGGLGVGGGGETSDADRALQRVVVSHAKTAVREVQFKVYSEQSTNVHCSQSARSNAMRQGAQFGLMRSRCRSCFLSLRFSIPQHT